MKEAEKPMAEAKEIVKKRMNRQKLSEFKGYSECPTETKNVFYALMAIFNKEATWENVKTYLRDIQFDELKDVEKLKVTEKGNFQAIQKYSRTFNFDILKAQSSVIPDLATYIQCVEKYFKAKWVAEVKQRQFMEANKNVLQSIQLLAELEKQLDDLNKIIEDLEMQLQNGKDNLERVKNESKAIKDKLLRASSLTTAFAKEEEHWNKS